jgi:geranylgeranyl pyrophosphate synthase
MSEPLADQLVDLLEQELAALLEQGEARGVPRRLWEQVLFDPIRGVLRRPGKAFRARLVDLGWSAGSGVGPVPPRLPLIIECLHAGSLVVDDIQDGSTHRRGGDTLHRTHGVPTAINCGNWLYFWAFEMLARARLPPATELALQRRVSATAFRCHFGQALDVGVDVADLPQEEVRGVVLAATETKAGGLTGLALELGALAAGAPPARVEALASFGTAVGVGLQMLDDCGGLVGTREPHKRWEDLRLARPTWPWAWLADDLDAARYRALQDEQRAVSAGARTPEALATSLLAALDGRGRARAHAHLAAALEQLGAALGDGAVLDRIAGELGQLEISYG